jgi:hypothetical protein
MPMLRVSFSDTAGGQRWSLCGRLAGPWVDELRSCWRQLRARAPRAPAVVDLKDVTYIDETGEELLSEMQTGGAEFVAAGVENKHLLACLKDKNKHPPQRRLEPIKAPGGAPETPEGGDE